MTKTVIIAGALGIVGRAVLDYYEQRPEWDIIALSRRPPDFPTRAKFISVDLSSPDDCRRQLSAITGVTHAVYCALYGRSSSNGTWSDEEQIIGNTRMLENFLDAVEATNPRLEHVSLLQGAKAYGGHLGAMAVPGKESAPRHMHPNFYWTQEDLIRDRSQTASWVWTIFRPQYIVGFSIGSPINILAALGVYAAVSREMGLPLTYPGTTNRHTEATDSRLLAKAIGWAQGAKTAANEVFNVANGDVFTFQNVFPTIAHKFGIEIGLNQAGPLTVLMSGKEKLWAQMVQKYGLHPYTIDQLVGASWAFADTAFTKPDPALIISTIKIRQAGFHDCIDSDQMFVDWLDDLQDRKILPR